MKGVVFTEFMQLVEDTFSPETLDRVVDKAKLDNDGAYTSVGTYDYREILTLVTCLSDEVGVPIPDLVKTFGRYLFAKLVKSHPDFATDDLFSMLESVEDHIHVEVRKLYPDADLPTFAIERVSTETLRMDYQSSRPFADLAEGLIAGCAEHFDDPIQIERTDFDVKFGYYSRFQLTRCGA